MATIRTAQTSNASGRTQVVAKGAGKQRTVSWQQDKSTAWNHGYAAAHLAVVLGLTYHDGVTHTMNEAGTKHEFTF